MKISRNLNVFIGVFVFIVGMDLFPWLSYGADQALQPTFVEFPLPKSLSLFGEPMPLENQSVREMLDRELTVAVWDQGQVFMWYKRTGRYFPFIEQNLRQAGMPDDLKYLSVAESSLINDIRSSAGALGSWQFMAQTGSNHGLRRDHFMDERLDFERSTEAALKYLQNLKEVFGSWTLAVAAYNCGEVRLKKEIEEQKVADYYRLDLPKETERYIFRLAAIKLILENPEQYGYVIERERIFKPVPTDAVPVLLHAPIHVTELALSLGTDYKVIKKLNPQIVGNHLPPGAYTLRVPAGLGEKAAEAMSEFTRRADQAVDKTPGPYYVVQPGDTLSGISVKTGVPMDLLKRLNGIEGSVITVGQRLRLSS